MCYTLRNGYIYWLVQLYTQVHIFTIWYTITLLQWYVVVYTSIYTYWYTVTLLQWYAIVYISIYTYWYTVTLLQWYTIAYTSIYTYWYTVTLLQWYAIVKYILVYIHTGTLLHCYNGAL